MPTKEFFLPPIPHFLIAENDTLVKHKSFLSKDQTIGETTNYNREYYIDNVFKLSSMNKINFGLWFKTNQSNYICFPIYIDNTNDILVPYLYKLCKELIPSFSLSMDTFSRLWRSFYSNPNHSRVIENETLKSIRINIQNALLSDFSYYFDFISINKNKSWFTNLSEFLRLLSQQNEEKVDDEPIEDIISLVKRTWINTSSNIDNSNEIEFVGHTIRMKTASEPSNKGPPLYYIHSTKSGNLYVDIRLPNLIRTYKEEERNDLIDVKNEIDAFLRENYAYIENAGYNLNEKIDTILSIFKYENNHSYSWRTLLGFDIYMDDTTYYSSLVSAFKKLWIDTWKTLLLKEISVQLFPGATKEIPITKEDIDESDMKNGYHNIIKIEPLLIHQAIFKTYEDLVIENERNKTILLEFFKTKKYSADLIDSIMLDIKISDWKLIKELWSEFYSDEEIVLDANDIRLSLREEKPLLFKEKKISPILDIQMTIHAKNNKDETFKFNNKGKLSYTDNFRNLQIYSIPSTTIQIPFEEDSMTCELYIELFIGSDNDELLVFERSNAQEHMMKVWFITFHSTR